VAFLQDILQPTWDSFGWRGGNPIESDGFKAGVNLSPPLLEKTTRFSDEIPARVYHLSPFAR
jgi:hypothetical protein